MSFLNVSMVISIMFSLFILFLS